MGPCSVPPCPPPPLPPASAFPSASESSRSKEEAKQQLKHFKKKLDAGASFKELAEKHSECSSAKKGGDLGMFGRNRMQKPFEVRPALPLYPPSGSRGGDPCVTPPFVCQGWACLRPCQ